MGKYNDLNIVVGELRDVADLIDALTLFSENSSYISIDHVQIGDCNGEIIGKVQWENDEWTFHARRHDKPGTLGE
jgi:hypothetical protein